MRLVTLGPDLEAVRAGRDRALEGNRAHLFAVDIEHRVRRVGDDAHVHRRGVEGRVHGAVLTGSGRAGRAERRAPFGADDHRVRPRGQPLHDHGRGAALFVVDGHRRAIHVRVDDHPSRRALDALELERQHALPPRLDRDRLLKRLEAFRGGLDDVVTGRDVLCRGGRFSEHLAIEPDDRAGGVRQDPQRATRRRRRPHRRVDDRALTDRDRHRLLVGAHPGLRRGRANLDAVRPSGQPLDHRWRRPARRAVDDHLGA